MGTGVERTRVAVAGLRLAECGTKGAGSPSTRQTLRPHICTDKPRGPDSEWRRAGQAEQWVAPRGTTFAHRETGQTAGSKADHVTQGSSSGK